MLKLVDAKFIYFKSVREYYDTFFDKVSDLNNYGISIVKNGEEEYYKYINNHNEYLYYLIDTENPEYIIGFGSIEDSRVLNYHLDYLNIGNISYGVRISERNRGYGSLILNLLLEKCEKLGMREVCISCKKENFASKKIIEKNNGIFEKEFYDEFCGCGLKYWIKIKPKLSNQIKRLIRIYRSSI